MAYGIVRSGFLIKVKFNLEHGVKAHRSRSMALLSLTSALDGGGGVNDTPRPLCPRERDPVPIVKEYGWAGSGRVRKILPSRVRGPSSSLRVAITTELSRHISRSVGLIIFRRNALFLPSCLC